MGNKNVKMLIELPDSVDEMIVAYQRRIKNDTGKKIDKRKVVVNLLLEALNKVGEGKTTNVVESTVESERVLKRLEMLEKQIEQVTKGEVKNKSIEDTPTVEAKKITKAPATKKTVKKKKKAIKQEKRIATKKMQFDIDPSYEGEIDESLIWDQYRDLPILKAGRGYETKEVHVKAVYNLMEEGYSKPDISKAMFGILGEKAGRDKIDKILGSKAGKEFKSKNL